jgi:hypothetical protein
MKHPLPPDFVRHGITTSTDLLVHALRKITYPKFDAFAAAFPQCASAAPADLVSVFDPDSGDGRIDDPGTFGPEVGALLDQVVVSLKIRPVPLAEALRYFCAGLHRLPLGLVVVGPKASIIIHPFEAYSVLLLQRIAAESLDVIRLTDGSYVPPRQVERFYESVTGEEFVVITNRTRTSTAILLSEELPNFRLVTAA